MGFFLPRDACAITCWIVPIDMTIGIYADTEGKSNHYQISWWRTLTNALGWESLL